MKILCIADQKDPVIDSINIKARFENVDMILSAGDLEVEYYNYIVNSLNKPLFFVFGNHNTFFLDILKENNKACFDLIHKNIACKKDDIAIYIGGKVKKIDGLIIAGLDGSMKYNNGPNQYTEIGMFLHIMKLIPRLILNKLLYGRYLDVLLTHAPPRGIHDQQDRCHKGFKVFLWLINIFKPTYFIHGHIHLYDRNKKQITKVNETTIINAFKYTVIDT